MANSDSQEPVGFLFTYPMTYHEAMAYCDLDAGIATQDQRAMLQAWAVKMTLAHGTDVVDLLAHHQMWDASQA